MSFKIALAGNPNCGKTTLFNQLTGLNQYIGNWTGVTVEKKEGKLKGKKNVTITDLPGIYSLSPYTPEELVTRDFLLTERPDVILNIIDGTNLERNLFLTTELLELSIPVVVALNMADVMKKNGNKIDAEKLSERLGCSVVIISALKGLGVKEAVSRALAIGEAQDLPKKPHIFQAEIENALFEIEQLITGNTAVKAIRFCTVKLIGRDKLLTERCNLSETEQGRLNTIITSVETKTGKNSEDLLTAGRYGFIAEMMKDCITVKNEGETVSDKIDRIVTNRFLAFPIFALAMFLLYFISISTVGTYLTDFVNDTFFGEWLLPAAEDFLINIGAADWLRSLIVDGIIGGVGSVLGFVPQIFLLFFLLSVLEDCGYMTRVAFIMDRGFRKIGLSGKSFIPMLISSGCAVPGILAAKTIEHEKDRRITILSASFIPCSAKLPVIALIGGAMFPKIVWMAPAMYFAGILAVVFSGITLSKSRLFSEDTMPFIMELPQYHLPSAKSLFVHMWERGKAFIVKAGTVIFLACAVIWFLTNFGISGGQFGMTEQQDSLLAAIGSFIAPIFAPLGFGIWQTSVATVSGLIAKENIVGTLSVLLGGAAEGDGVVVKAIPTLFSSSAAALSFLLFNLLCAPCVAAMSAIYREMSNKKWAIFAISYQTLLAYAVALIVYQLGKLFAGFGFDVGTVAAFLVLLFMLFLLFRPVQKQRT